MRTDRWIIGLTLLFVLGVAEQAFAWGPATHVGLGASILGDLALLPGVIGAILARHGWSYLYGNIAADVVFAKRLSRVKQFCHHWTTGFRLLDAATDAPSKAFAYGYLSHLAADTVAHGKYVPRQIIVSDCSINWGHFYWELRAENVAPEADRKLLDRVLHLDHDEHDRDLAPHITDTFLPYPMNRLLFHGMNAIAVKRRFRRTVDACSLFARQPLPHALLAGYRDESLERIMSVLTLGVQSPVLWDDPNGTSALMSLHVRRREMRRLRRRGLSLQRRMIETSHGLEPARSGAARRASASPVAAGLPGLTLTG